MPYHNLNFRSLAMMEEIVVVDQIQEETPCGTHCLIEIHAIEIEIATIDMEVVMETGMEATK